MKQFYLNSLFLIVIISVLTSCNPKYRFITKGLSKVDSSYVITKQGMRIDANEVIVRKNTLTVDGKEMKLNGLSAIRSKKMYFAVNDGELYFGEVHGKINMLYKVAYSTTYNSYGTAGGAYGAGNYSHSASKIYYLQKDGSTTIDKLNKSILMEYLSDNEDALIKAKASYGWQYGSYAAGAGFVTGIVLTVSSIAKNSNNSSSSSSLGGPLAVLGGSYIAFLVANSISHHKMMKAIYIYDGIQ